MTADHKIKTYGDDNPTLTATVTGTVNGDTLNYSLATTALKFSNVGDYPITVSLGSNPNYKVSTRQHADDRPEGGVGDRRPQDARPTATTTRRSTATVTGTVNGDTLNYTLATTALQVLERRRLPDHGQPGLQPQLQGDAARQHADDRPEGGVGDGGRTRRRPTGTTTRRSTATVTGTVNGDTLNYSLATTALKFSNVGDYPITVSLGSNPNYTGDAEQWHADNREENADGHTGR